LVLTLAAAAFFGLLPAQHPEVRTRISVLFEEEMAASNLSASDQQAIASDANSGPARKLKLDLRKVWVQRVADQNFRGIVNFLRKQSTFVDNSFSSTHFVASSWGEIDVQGDKATALVTGHTEITTKHGVKRPPDTNWKLLLHFDQASKNWLLESRTGKGGDY